MLNCATAFVAWSVSLNLIYVETHKVLPSIPSRGHGLILIVFWTLAFVVENCSIILLRSDDWFWSLDRYLNMLAYTHVVSKLIDVSLTIKNALILTSIGAATRFGLWIFRYLATCALFALGFYAPGIPRQRYGLAIVCCHLFLSIKI